MNTKKDMEIFEVVQFASDEKEFAKLNFDTLTDDTIVGKEEICDYIGSGFVRKTVKSDDEPMCGSVWYKKDKNGKCKIYKYHYDTSD